MPFAIRHQSDPAPLLPPIPGLTVRREENPHVIARLQNRPVDAMRERFDAGHRVYIASLYNREAAWGWVATTAAAIGEVGAEFRIPEGDRYLWNFVTLPEHRGMGIYPRLVDEIVRRESVEAHRFWIGYAPENHASGAGIRKAGFRTVAELSFDIDGRPAVRSIQAGGGKALSRLLDVRETGQHLTPCWRCVRAGRGAMACGEGECACDYQRVESGCAV